MSKITSVALLIALALVAVFTLLPEPAYALTGSGTVGDPYIVWNVTDLQAMEDDLTAYYELGADIDATATSGWNGGAGFDPIGDTSTPFSGFFDGKGYTITGLYINRDQNDVGLFGVVKSTAAGVTRYIRNVNLVDSYIGTSTTNSYFGTLVGRIKQPDFSTALVHISSVHVTNTTIRASGKQGGLIGHMEGYVTVQYCSVDDVNFNRTSRTGGLIGESAPLSGSNTIYRCAATNVYMSYAAPYYTGYVGGFIGVAEDTTIRECYSHGYIHSQGGSPSYTAQRVGGFVGSAHGAVIYDSYAMVTVSTTYGSDVGGFAGRYGVFYRCYSAGLVTTISSNDVGGFSGDDSAGCTACFWDKEASGQATSDCGTGKLTTEMKTETTFTNVNWDFDDIWGMFVIVNDGYPHLRCNTTYYQSVWFQPNAIIEGTTLPNRTGYEDGIITWGGNPDGITITQGLFTPETDYTFMPVIPDTLDIIDPEPGGMTSDVALDRLTRNPLRPLAQILSSTGGMTERLAWLGIAIFVLIALMIYVQLKTTHIVFTSLVGLGVATSFYLIGVFPLWVVVLLVFGLVGSIIYERMPVL